MIESKKGLQPHEVRVVEERAELMDKITKLHTFMASKFYQTLDTTAHWHFEEQEKAIHLVGKEAMGEPEQMASEPIPIELVAMKGATRSFANKLLAEKTIELEVIYLETHKGEAHE